jgi:hypothetical protein
LVNKENYHVVAENANVASLGFVHILELLNMRDHIIFRNSYPTKCIPEKESPGFNFAKPTSTIQFFVFPFP